MERRRFLKLAGGSGLVLAAGGITAFATTRTPTHALGPWAQAGHYNDPRKFALSYALLAPNPHNRQPWEIGLHGDDVIIIDRDKTKKLPHTDPFDRQLTIGMGCFLELLTIAATARGYRAVTTYFPDGADGPLAHIQFQDGAVQDDLFDQILHRRSCKEGFDTRRLNDTQINILSHHGHVVHDAAEVAHLQDLTWRAWMVEYETPRTQRESVELMRFGKRAINENPDGIAMGGAMLEAMNMLGVLDAETAADPSSTAYRQGIDMFRPLMMSTPHYIMLKTPANDRVSQLDTGRRWARLNLTTTAMGLALHPVSQALQEYQEMATLYRDIHKTYAAPGETIQMLGRLGYGPKVPPAPRWGLEEKLV
ncbi:MAG: twin-arginine translocation pathway signal protein [Alphaproteobacteria bacterium]